MEARRRHLRAVLAMLSVTWVWGWAFVWMKQGLAAGDAWLAERGGGGAGTAGVATTIGVFLALRFGASALALAAVARRARSGLGAAEWKGGLVLGGLLLAGFVLQMFGLHSVTPSVSAFLTSLYILFTAAITSIQARRAPRLELFLGALLATAGAAYIGGPPQIAFGAGEWLTVACALVFAVHIVMTDRITKRVDPIAVTQTSFVVVAAGSAALAALGFASDGVPGPQHLGALLSDAEFLLPLSLAALFATLIAIPIMNVFQRELDPVRAAIIYAVEPVWAAAISIALYGEQPTLWLWLGGGAMLAGNWIAELRFPRRAPAGAA